MLQSADIQLPSTKSNLYVEFSSNVELLSKPRPKNIPRSMLKQNPSISDTVQSKIS